MVTRRAVRDCAFVAGILLVSLGAGMIYVPAGLIVLGCVLVVAAIAGHRNDP